MDVGSRVRLKRTHDFNSFTGTTTLSAGERGYIEEVAGPDAYVNFDCGHGSWCSKSLLQELGQPPRVKE